ncbi:MAG: glycosyltransferase family 39 protein [Planctomycetota bacterium]
MAAHPGSDSPPAAVRLPSLRDPWLLLVLLGAASLQALAWSRLEGYQLADAVEYMDRAWAVAQGQALDPGTVRSFAFSGLLLPFFAVAEWFGLEDLRPVVSAVRLGQMALGWLAVLIVARAGARLWGRPTGIACGAFLGLNPIFAQYTISPLAATTALLSMAIAVGVLARVATREEATFGRGALLGASLGAALLMAFKTIPLIGLLLLSLLARRSWRRREFLLGAALAFVAALLGQACLDWWTYGRFGSSLGTYLLTTVAPMAATLLYKAGAVEIATKVYEAMPDVDPSGGGEMRSRYPMEWYVTQATERALVWPVAVLTLVGVLRVVAARRFVPLLVLAVVLSNLVLLSIRGHKDFRLWMPSLPFVALLGGAGWHLLFASGARGPSRWRGTAGAIALIVAWALGGLVLTERNLQKYGGYWRAMELFADLRAEGKSLRVASAYDWAVRFRSRSGLELVKLPAHLDEWPKLDAAEQAAVLETLAGLDGFMGHLQVIEQDPRILRAVNERFEVVDVIDDRATMEELEPIYVLRRRTGDPGAKTFYEVHTDTGPGEPHDVARYQAQIEYPRSVDFRRRMADGSVRQMVLLGVDVESGLADGAQAWVTYHWYAGPLGGGDYVVVDRLTDRDGGGYNANHRPTHGAVPTTEWQPGWVVAESFCTRFGPRPGHFGGNWRRGELLPVELWMAIVEYDADQNQIGGLSPFHASGERPIHRQRVDGRVLSDDGRTWSNDALMRVGGFWMPLVEARRVPDDGRPLALAR